MYMNINRDQFRDSTKNLSSPKRPHWFWRPTTPFPNIPLSKYPCIFHGGKPVRGVKMTTRLYLSLRLRMSGVIRRRPHVFMTYIKKVISL